jgi:glutaminyl-peptide cyclotransferase
MIKRFPTRIVLSIGSIICIFAIIFLYFDQQQKSNRSTLKFDGQEAYKYIQYQMSLGPRIPSSSSHEKVVLWMQMELQRDGWYVEVQNVTIEGHSIQNVIAKRGGGGPWIILGAHYDSRLWADQDPNPALRQTPVPGAEDGASGVSVLLELAKSLPENLKSNIWLVFFDAEDDGNIPGWNWLLGSQAFVDSLIARPDKVVIIDMIGDANLNIYKERTSNSEIISSVWSQAASLGYSSYFIDQYKYSMLDDQTPFLNDGIPAIDIIVFDYPYWHTTQDTIDKISEKSLQIVGDTLWHWLIAQSG